MVITIVLILAIRIFLKEQIFLLVIELIEERLLLLIIADNRISTSSGIRNPVCALKRSILLKLVNGIVKRQLFSVFCPILQIVKPLPSSNLHPVELCSVP